MLFYVVQRAAWAVLLCLIVALLCCRSPGTATCSARSAAAAEVETAFGLPGLGQTLRNALIRNDLPVIVGVVVVSVLVIAIANFLGEVIQAMIDPRVKLRPEPAPA